MHLRNKNSRGNGMVVAIIAIVVILGALGAYFYTKGGGGLGLASSKPAIELAKFLPAESENFVAADLSGGIWSKLQSAVEQHNNDKYPEFQKAMKETETEIGIPVKDFLSYLDGRFALSIVRDGRPPTGMALVGLKDPAAYKAWMTKQHGESTDTVGGVPFWKLSYGAVMGMNDQWVFWCRSGEDVATGLKAAEKLVASSQGSGELLANHPTFKKATTQVDLSKSEIVTFNNLETAGAQLSGIGQLGFDKRTETLLADVKFAVAGVNLIGRSSEGLIGVEGGETNLAKAMTGEGRMKAEALNHISETTSFVVGLDIQWTLDMIVALGELHSEARNQVAMVPMGLSMMGVPMDGIDGGAWLATDLLDVSYESAKMSVINGTDSVPPPDPSALLLVPTKDNKAIDAFFAKSMGTEASDLKDGEVRDYPSPDPDAKLVLDSAKNLIKMSIGKNVASLEATSGNISSKSVVSDLQKWGGSKIVYLDYVDFTSMAKKLEKEEDPELVAVRNTIKYWGKDTIDGGLCVATSPEGLRYKAMGTGGGLSMYTGMITAIAAPNFMKARGAGMLTACKSNERNIATALEMYSTDWSGKYPKDTTLLVPNYLKTIPACPAAETDTYSGSYQVKKLGPDASMEGYSFYCKGENHVNEGLAPNKPAYNALEGLIE